MGGIIGKFFHEFGITIVAAVLISMFVSFTLDPMLSSVWHDPSIDSRTASSGPPVTLYDKTIGRITGLFDSRYGRASPMVTRASCAGHCSTSWPQWALALCHFCGQHFHGAALLGTEFVPEVRLFRNHA